MAFSNVALFGGAFLTPVVVGKMTATLGWQWSFYFVAIFTAVALPFVFFFVPETAFRRPEYLNTDFTGDDNLSGSQTRFVDPTVLSSTGGHVHDRPVEPEKEINPAQEEGMPTSTEQQAYSYWKTLRLFNGRKTDENFLKLFLRPFPLFFFHPGILWVSHLLFFFFFIFLGLMS